MLIYLLICMIMSEWLCLCVATITSLLLVAAYICLYSGLLSAITVVAGSPPIKKILFAYKYNEGPYRDCEKISRESLSIGPKLPCIYVFYDDPQKVKLDTHHVIYSPPQNTALPPHY